MKQRYQLGIAAILIGMALNHLGDRLLGVKIELFSGLSTFSFAWILDVFFVPFLVGLVVAWIFGMGGKWLCYFPPLIVRSLSYAEILYVSGAPHGSSLNPMGWWGLYVILAMESAGIGGIVGEVMIKKVYGRSAKNMHAEKEQPVAAGKS
ncbi:MAG: hypothetical protein WCE58_13345 [Gallionella sp.]